MPLPHLLCCSSGIVLFLSFFLFLDVLGQRGPSNRFSFESPRCRRACVCPVYANASARMSAHFDKRGLSRRAPQSRPQQRPDTRLHTGAGVPPAHPPLLCLTYKQPGICHREGGVVSHTHTHTRQHAGMQTHTHPDTWRSLVVCSRSSL